MQRLQVDRIDQVDLVDADDGPDPGLFGRDQHAVDQVRFEHRFGSAADNQQLVDVGDDHLLAPATRAAEDAVAGLNTFDDPFLLLGRPKPHAIAGRHDVPLVGTERFQQPPCGAAHLLARVVQHDTDQAMHAQDPTGTADRRVHIQLHGQSAVASRGLGADHGPLARQGPFAADPLGLRRLLLFVEVLSRILAGHVPIAPRVL